MKSLLFIFVILAMAFGTITQIQAEDLQNSTSQVEQNHEQLMDVKDDTTLSPEEKLRKEIDARVNIVKSALSLSLQEISNLRENLNNLPQFNEGSPENVLRERFLADLKTSQDYYTMRQDEMGETSFTLDTIKDFAKSIINYRDTVYNPKTADIVDFALFFYTEDAIAIAKTRLTKINADIKKLETLSIIETGYFKASIDRVSATLDDSDALNLEAKDLIFAEYALDTTEVIPEPENSPVLEQTLQIAPAVPPQATIEIIVPPTARELLVKSLGNIKSAYEIFVQIGTDTKKILGIR